MIFVTIQTGGRQSHYVRNPKRLEIINLTPALTASTLLRKMTLAIPQAVIHHRALSAFTESLQVERAKELKEWEEQVRKWESDKVLPSPYDLPEQSTSSHKQSSFRRSYRETEVTFAQVKYQLSREEHEQVEKGEIYLNIGDMSPSAFVVAALELEENQ